MEAVEEAKLRTVYLLHNRDSETGKDTYVGSTSQSLKKRLGEHRSAASRPGNENNRLYRRMLEVGLKTGRSCRWRVRLAQRMKFESSSARGARSCAAI